MRNRNASTSSSGRGRRLPSLDLLRGFEAAARHLSFTKAAEELFLTQSAVSRQVQALEQQLGVPLFQRRHRALLLTDAGQMLYRTAAEVLRTVRQAVERIAPAGGNRVLTVTAMVTFASLWLVPRLPAFRKAHPDIEAHISANNDIVDLERSRIDVAIRYTAPDRVQASAVPLFGEQVLPVCSPALLRDRSRPLKSPRDLHRHLLLHMDDAPCHSPWLHWDVWLEAMGLGDLEAAGSMTFSHYDQLIQAALDGEGVALGRTPLLSRLLDQKRLVAPFEPRKLPGKSPASLRAYFVLTAPGASARPEVKDFVAWLLQEAGSDTVESAPASVGWAERK